MLNVKEVIEKLDLQKLEPEGGYFRRSAEVVKNGQVIASSIYYLLDANDYSAMHRLDADEIYHFYMGDPLELLELRPDGSSETTIMGNDLASGMKPQLQVKKNVWQGSIVLNNKYGFSLLGTTMCPSFREEGFELADIALLEAFPEQKEHILKRLRDSD